MNPTLLLIMFMFFIIAAFIFGYKTGFEGRPAPPPQPNSDCADKFNTLVDMQIKLEGCEAGVTALEEGLASVDVCAVSAVSMTFKEHSFLACMDSCLNDNMPKPAVVNDWTRHCWEQCIPMEGAKG